MKCFEAEHAIPPLQSNLVRCHWADFRTLNDQPLRAWCLKMQPENQKGRNQQIEIGVPSLFHWMNYDRILWLRLCRDIGLHPLFCFMRFCSIRFCSIWPIFIGLHVLPMLISSSIKSTAMVSGTQKCKVRAAVDHSCAEPQWSELCSEVMLSVLRLMVDVVCRGYKDAIRTLDS